VTADGSRRIGLMKRPLAESFDVDGSPVAPPSPAPEPTPSDPREPSEDKTPVQRPRPKVPADPEDRE